MNFFKTKQKILTKCIFTLFVLTTVVMPVVPRTVHAQDLPTDPADASGSFANYAANSNDMTADLSTVNADDLNFGCTSNGFSVKMLAGCLSFLTYWVFFFPMYTLAGWSGILFNLAFMKLVVGMGPMINSMTGIMLAWETLRDIGNVFLVFLLVYVGIATILGISGYGYKKLLWKIILAALLVNFSITFAKVVIDVSNIFAIEMYETFMLQTNPGYSVGACLAAASNPSDTPVIEGDPCVENGIAGAFWTALKITTIFNIAELNDVAADDGSSSKLMWKVLLTLVTGALLSLVMAFVFGAAAFLLVGRFVMLVFLMIVSPVALIAWITKVSNKGSQWWHSLLNQSFFAPLILLMWWVAYIVAGGIVPNDSLGTTGTITGPAVSLIMSFVIIMGFLLMGLVLAKQFGAAGASAAMSTGKQWAKKGALMAGAGAGAATVGTSAFLARQTAGRAAARYAKSDDVNKRASNENKNAISRTLARAQIAASQRVAGSSFDPRSTKKAGWLGKAGGKGGYTKHVEDKKKAEIERDKNLANYQGTSKERGEYQQKLAKENRDFETAKKESAQETLKSNLNLIDGSIKRINTSIEQEKAKPTPNTAKISQLEERQKMMKEQKRSTVALQTAFQERRVIEDKLTDNTLSAKERGEYEKERGALTATIKNGYGVINDRVKESDTQINTLKKEINAEKTKDGGGDKKAIANLEAKMAHHKQTRDVIVNYHEAKTADDRMKESKSLYSPDEYAKLLTDSAENFKNAEAELDNQRITNRQRVSQENAEDFKKKGEALQAANRDGLSTQKKFFGMIPTPGWKRDVVAKIRKDGSLSEKEKAVRNLVKTLEEESKESADDSSATPPPPTPTTPPTETKST